MAITPEGNVLVWRWFCCRMHFCNKDILAEVIIDFWGPVPTPAKDPINSLIHYLLLLVIHDCCWFRFAIDWRPLDNEKNNNIPLHRLSYFLQEPSMLLDNKNWHINYLGKPLIVSTNFYATGETYGAKGHLDLKTAEKAIVSVLEFSSMAWGRMIMRHHYDSYLTVGLDTFPPTFRYRVLMKSHTQGPYAYSRYWWPNSITWLHFQPKL